MKLDPTLTETRGVLTRRYWIRHPAKAVRLQTRALLTGRAALEETEEALPEPIRRVAEKFSEQAGNRECLNHHYYGGRYQSPRVAALADLTVGRYAGDIVEIGARLGTTTCLLAPVARRHGRKVIVIDPWIPGTQDCDGSEYDQFLENTREFAGSIDIWRYRSDAREVFERMRGRALAFAFVDGLHTFDACMSDFGLVKETRGLIVADDARYNVEVCLAARIRAKEFGWRVVQPRSLKEAYLFRPEAFPVGLLRESASGGDPGQGDLHPA